MLNRIVFPLSCLVIICSTTSCMKEIDGPLDITLSPYPKVELNLEQELDYKAKIYYSLATKEIIKTSDNYSWHIAFASQASNPHKVLMNYALGKSTWGATRQDTNWARTITQAELFSETQIYANHYDSFANLFQRGFYNVYYLNFGSNLVNKKFQVLSYTATEVSFRYANLDGSNEITKTITLNPNTNYTYISLIDASAVDVEPIDRLSWDFEVTRYTTYVTDFSQPQMYGVGGFISNPAKNILVAKVENKNLEDLSDASLTSLPFNNGLTSIGYDWKKFSNGGPDGFYTILPRSYVIKADGKTYGIQFISYTKTIAGKPINGYPVFLLREF